MRNNKCADNPFVVARKAAGLKQAQTAEALGVDRSAVAAWETGRALPNAAKLARLAEIYHCAIGDLLGPIGKETESA